MKQTLRYLINSLMIVLVVSCGGGGDGDGGGGGGSAETAPSITNFTSSFETITADLSADLTATFSNGTGSIDNGVGNVTSGMTKSVSPTSTTTYKLTVTSPSGVTTTSSVTVTVVAVLPAPTITSFTASATTMALGSSVNLTAVFSNGVGSIDNSVGTVISNVAKSVTPASITTYTYTLTVTNAASTSVTLTVTVTVLPAYNIFPPGFFGGSYSRSITLNGTDTLDAIHAATLLEESGFDTDFNSQSVKAIEETLLITNIGVGTFGGLSQQYWTTDLNNLKYVGYLVDLNNVATAISNSVMPIATYIGDSGTMGSYERSIDGSTFTITWELVADTGSNAKYITTTVSRDGNANATLDYTATVNNFINQLGEISKQTIVIVYHQESNRTLTLTSVP